MQTYGPDRAIYRHWLDREPKAVIGIASVLRAFRRRLGAPTSIVRNPGRVAYVWQAGFDRHSITVFHSS